MSDELKAEDVGVVREVPANEEPAKKPSTPEQKAGLVDGVRSARKRYEAATAALNAARLAERTALTEQAQALNALQGARKGLEKETEASE